MNAEECTLCDIHSNCSEYMNDKLYLSDKNVINGWDGESKHFKNEDCKCYVDEYVCCERYNLHQKEIDTLKFWQTLLVITMVVETVTLLQIIAFRV